MGSGWRTFLPEVPHKSLKGKNKLRIFGFLAEMKRLLRKEDLADLRT
jgi:hypothetical protein